MSGVLSNDDFEIKSKIYNLNCLSCFIHILNCKMSLFFGFSFFLYSTNDKINQYCITQFMTRSR